MTHTPLRILPTPDAIGDDLAARILALVAEARAAGRSFLLGCPTGRTPRPIYAAMARRLQRAPQDLSHLVLVMMDEYLVERGSSLAYAPSDQPWSCHHFARAEIAGPLNGALPASQRIADEAIWFPDPSEPDEYERRIARAGGVDFFLLASGAGDGHVAFNPPGSERDSRTRIVPLSEQTRRDNLKTFPTFGTLDAVPHHGVSIGVATIRDARRAAMVVWGPDKRETLRRMLRTDRYESDWPATLIHECAVREIVCDVAAAGERSSAS